MDIAPWVDGIGIGNGYLWAGWNIEHFTELITHPNLFAFSVLHVFISV